MDHLHIRIDLTSILNFSSFQQSVNRDRLETNKAVGI